MKKSVKYLLTPRIQRLYMIIGLLITINFTIILLRLMIPVTFSYLVIRFPLFVFDDFLESFKNPRF